MNVGKKHEDEKQDVDDLKWILFNWLSCQRSQLSQFME